MKKTFRLLALIFALLFALSAAGCSLPSDTDELEELYGILEEISQYAEELDEEPLPGEIFDFDEPDDPEEAEPDFALSETETPLAENGIYTTKEDVALYIHTYGHLPSNFITKDEAEELGWSGGGLDPYAEDMCIGGDRFGNYEGLLPKASGRTYTECDIDTLNASSRGAKRIVFSNDGLIYYTEDHYESFELLYGEP